MSLEAQGNAISLLISYARRFLAAYRKGSQAVAKAALRVLQRVADMSGHTIYEALGWAS